MYLQRSTGAAFPLLATRPTRDKKTTLYIGRRVFEWRRREGGPGTMGRFGGGWEIKFGFQAGSWRDLFLLDGVIFDLFTSSLSCRRQDGAYRNEAAARALAHVPPETAAEIRRRNFQTVEKIVDAARRLDQ